MVNYPFIWSELIKEVKKVSVPDIAPFFTSNEIETSIFEPTTAEEEMLALEWVRKLRTYLDKATEDCECRIRVLAQALHELEVERAKEDNREIVARRNMYQQNDNIYTSKLSALKNHLRQITHPRTSRQLSRAEVSTVNTQEAEIRKQIEDTEIYKARNLKLLEAAR